MLSRLRAIFRRPPSTSPNVEATETGFVLRDAAGGLLSVEWARVRRVVAYKRDLFATDCIVLAFELDPTAAVTEVSEEWPGFSTLFAGMEAALGVSPAWYLEIMTPVFEPTPRILYVRAQSQSDSGSSPG